MKTKAFIVLLLAFMLQACNSSDITEGNAIDASLRKTIKDNNDRLIRAFSTSEIKEYRALGSEDFLKHLQGKISKVVGPFRQMAINPDYKVYKEYHVTNERVPGFTIIESEEDNYKITLQNTTKQTYLSMLHLKYNMTDDCLLSVVYSLVDGAWKVSDVKLGQWGIDGKNALDYFAQAQKSEKDGFILDAFFAADVARTCLKPAGEMLVYNNADKIDFYAKEWLDQSNREYKHPHYLQLEGQPSILELTYVKNTEGTYPMIKYGTGTPVKDTVALAREHELIRKEIKAFYKGMDFTNKKYIYYRAFNGNLYGGYHEFKEVKTK